MIDLTVDTVRAIPGVWERSRTLRTRRSLVHDFRAFHQSLADCPIGSTDVKEIEQDLPLLLDLLNTLAQAGIAFDAALEQVLEANSPRRPLTKSSESFKSMFWRVDQEATP